MSPGVLLDTGPLVAYRRARDAHHAWALETFEALQPPLISCEPVLVETCFLLARSGSSAQWPIEMVARGIVQVRLQIAEEAAPISELMRRYANVPISLADACLVRLAELTGLPICTLDGNFAIYRAHRHRHLTLITPDRRSLHEA